MSPFQEDKLLVQLQLLNFIIFYILWPSQIATRPIAWCDLKRVPSKYTEVILSPVEEGEQHHKYTLFKCKSCFALTGYIVLACFMLCLVLKKMISFGGISRDRIKWQAARTCLEFPP